MAALSSYSMSASTPTFSFQQPPQTSSAAGGQTQHSFYPYTDNGGSTLGISGDSFTILAGDTRSTSGYNINTRHEPKLFRIGGSGPTHKNARIVLSVVGFAADGRALQERLDTIVKLYRYQHGKDISVHACAQRLSHILYGKRFFPYYVTAILGGIDEEGKGALYSYDPVNLKNQYEPEAAQGLGKPQLVAKPLDRKTTEELVRDAFTSAVERHIEVGDGLQMMVITKDGIEEIISPLKQD
ncbi:Proteasome subunit beta type-6 [Friedmanniomyces endolithicus]|uniref:Proteasome subunit beta type-6 n=1 Tax=Rachicladosporium monterosium TaxID=1507873 RepID=A0ABR0LD30_9PEZI|nr:Proteasome subunit beta type-6 [Friedmanniomyces endolithicus]KAK1085837.1 Proteasome subunit beta type-6 [Friedmanniomyces endolithicus]KAK5147017.1 Proteasome subunit beta type-6 [Rachicladosporium monterosium]